MAVNKVARRCALLDKIIRVDHAGELGARRIYEGQLFVLRNTNVGPTIAELHEQEKVHLRTFEDLIPIKRVRPSALLPIWNAGGFLLGMGTALLGKRAAMACTVAVESVISQHYEDQIRELLECDPQKYRELLQVLKQFRDDEIEHHDIGLQNEAEQTPFYDVLSTLIKTCCRVSVFVAERI